MKNRTVRKANITIDDEEVEWPYVEAEFEYKTRGENAFLIFEQFLLFFGIVFLLV